MSEAKRRKDSKKAALSKCWAEDIDWDLIPHALREGCGQIGKALSVPATSVLSGFLILISYFSSHMLW
ncbi:hypothetical protein OS493_007115 [Desmophyllum pertusum]|uniref:Uncharacterized protein n=1 Tax=Desmophyllum pertusum TaxID=174260 RepID=A0A9X0CYM5_9CNID|nr:hypothetical protein OS493_007115 [Desmophyllum pertusum]